MATFCNWWQLLATDGNFWQLMATFGNWWQLMATFGNWWQLFATNGIFFMIIISKIIIINICLYKTSLIVFEGPTCQHWGPGVIVIWAMPERKEKNVAFTKNTSYRSRPFLTACCFVTSRWQLSHLQFLHLLPPRHGSAHRLQRWFVTIPPSDQCIGAKPSKPMVAWPQNPWSQLMPLSIPCNGNGAPLNH